MLGSRFSGKIGSQFRFNDELNLASEKWSIGKCEPMKNTGISWSKSLAFILLQNAPQPRNPLRLEKIPPGTTQLWRGESYGVSVAIFGPGCFTGNSKTNIHVFVKQPDLCWTICTKGIDLATKRAQIQSCRIVSWSFQPLSRLAFVIRSESLEGSPFSTISKGYLPPYVLNPKKRPSFRRIAKFHIFFRISKRCVPIVKMHAIQSCSCGFLLVFQRLQPHSPCTVTLADRSFYPRLLQVR